MKVVKSSLDGSGHHLCPGKSTQQAMSMRGVVHLKMNLKTVFKKHDNTNNTGGIEMTDFTNSQDQSGLTEVNVKKEKFMRIINIQE